MSDSAFLDRIGPVPAPLSPSDAERCMTSFHSRMCQLDDPMLSQALQTIYGHPRGQALLHCLFGFSPFLSRLVLNDLGFFVRLCREGPEACLAATLAESIIHPPVSTAQLMKELRRAKARGSLLIAVADLTSYWPLENVTLAMSELGEACVRSAVSHLLSSAHAKGELGLSDPSRPEAGSGLIVLAMGKLGAHELNYSSDIDLIVLFDRERVAYRAERPVETFFLRLAQEMTRILQERTAEGYCFRVDLRLRPDPRSTPVAMPTAGALTYYETVGQNWERAAFIKARPIAGDFEAGLHFLRQITPFIWRRHLDFAAINDIQSIKRQMDAWSKSDISAAGHNVKTGLGGIREIEFFAQIHQLIWGGREVALRIRGTCATLSMLASKAYISGDLAYRLAESYRFLRTVEHRLQMVDDQQTHSLPDTNEARARFAAFMNYPNPAAFEEELLAHLRSVHETFSESFRGQVALGGEEGVLSFTGVENDRQTLQTLRKMGYANPESVSEVVQGWHRGTHRSTRTQRARELITELTPALLKALAASAHPDQAFIRFDAFLSGLPSGVQLFSLFHARPQLLDLLALIMGSAPALAESLSRRPDLLDSLLTAGFDDPLAGKQALFNRLAGLLIPARDFEDELDIIGRFKSELQFQAGIRLILRQADAIATGRYLSDIADTCLEALLRRVEVQLADRHSLEHGSLAAVAMGRLGARELTFGSDIDLVFVYENGQSGAMCNKLAQRFLGALTAVTRAGRLYDVDTRLRPSGHDGLLAVSTATFEHYLETSAWTFELMALTRARVVAGAPKLRSEIEAIIRRQLTKQRDPKIVRRDILDMRARVAAQFGSDDVWDLKYAHGGLMDLGFLAQYFVLCHAHRFPELIGHGNGAVFALLKERGLLDGPVAEQLLEAQNRMDSLFALLRLCAAGILKEETAPLGLQQLMAKTLDVADFAAVKKRLGEALQAVRKYYTAILAPSQPRQDGVSSAP